MNLTVSEAAAALRGADRILILTHRRPDGDTTGCAGALCRGLRALGKTAYVLPNPELTRRYADMITPCYPDGEFSPEYIVSVDIADYNLLSDNAMEYQDRIDLMLDHHFSNRMNAPKQLVRGEAGACAEVIYDILCELGVPFEKEIARCIYVAVSTDTGCFKFSNTTPRTHEVAAACLRVGVDGGEINRALFETKSLPRFNMERIIFETMEFLRQDTVAIATLRRADINQTGADMDDLDSIAGLPRTIEGVQIGITMTENTDGTVKISLRTTKEVDASAICAVLGGGGHVRAAGASVTGTVEEARVQILAAVEKVCGSC